MATQVLKNKQGNCIGEIREQSRWFVPHDKCGNRLGEYDPKANVTKNKQGNQVGTGNLLTTLLVDRIIPRWSTYRPSSRSSQHDSSAYPTISVATRGSGSIGTT